MNMTESKSGPYTKDVASEDSVMNWVGPEAGGIVHLMAWGHKVKRGVWWSGIEWQRTRGNIEAWAEIVWNIVDVMYVDTYR